MLNIIELKKIINIAKGNKRTTILTVSPKQQITNVKQLYNLSHLHIKNAN